MLPIPGEEFVIGEWTINQEFVVSYLASVSDALSIYEKVSAVPPLALASLVLASLMDRLSLPPGTIHAAQELDMGRITRLGERVLCKGSVRRPVVRAAWTFVAVDFVCVDSNHGHMLSGKTTVLVPRDEESRD